MNLIKYIVIFVLALFFIACEQRPYFYQIKNDQIILHNPTTNTTLETLNLKGIKPKYFNDSCTKFAHTLDLLDQKYGQLYIDSVVLNNDCRFQGQERGMFEYFLKLRSKLESIKLVEREEIQHYEFSRYLIDGKFHINLIYIWEPKRATFIIDYKGVFSNQLMKKLQINKQFPLNNHNFTINPPLSMVRDNLIQEFWNKK